MVVLHEVDAFANRLEHAELDAIVHELGEVTGTARPPPMRPRPTTPNSFATLTLSALLSSHVSLPAFPTTARPQNGPRGCSVRSDDS